MSYEKPAFVEVNLDAEIGSYQDDFGDLPTRRPAPEPVVESDEPASDER